MSTLIANSMNAPAPHLRGAVGGIDERQAATRSAGAGAKTVRQQLEATYRNRKSVPVATRRPAGSFVGATVKYPETAQRRVPAAEPALAYNTVRAALSDELATVPVSKPWTRTHAEGLLSTRGTKTATAKPELTLEEVAEDVAFALKRATSDADKDRLEDQLETLRALSAVKKTRGELSPEQKQVVREIALEVSRRHAATAKEAEKFIAAKGQVESENMAQAQALREADLEAKSDLAAALQAEAAAAGLEHEKLEAEDVATILDGQLQDAQNEDDELKAEFDQLANEKKAAETLLAELEADKKAATGRTSGARTRRKKLRTQINEQTGQLVAISEGLDELQKQREALEESGKQVYESALEARQKAKEINLAQQDALIELAASQANLQAAEDSLAYFTPQPIPVRRPQTRSQTRRRQKEASLARAVRLAVPASAAPTESKDDSAVTALGRPIDVLKRVADSLGVSYNRNANRTQVLAAIGRKNPVEARRYSRLALDI